MYDSITVKINCKAFSYFFTNKFGMNGFHRPQLRFLG